jgi:hypothetical protein
MAKPMTVESTRVRPMVLARPTSRRSLLVSSFMKSTPLPHGGASCPYRLPGTPLWTSYKESRCSYHNRATEVNLFLCRPGLVGVWEPPLHAASRGGLRRKAHPEHLPSFADRTTSRTFHHSPAESPGPPPHYQGCDYAPLQSRPPLPRTIRSRLEAPPTEDQPLPPAGEVCDPKHTWSRVNPLCHLQRLVCGR